MRARGTGGRSRTSSSGRRGRTRPRSTRPSSRSSRSDGEFTGPGAGRRPMSTLQPCVSSVQCPSSRRNLVLTGRLSRGFAERRMDAAGGRWARGSDEAEVSKTTENLQRDVCGVGGVGGSGGRCRRPLRVVVRTTHIWLHTHSVPTRSPYRISLNPAPAPTRLDSTLRADTPQALQRRSSPLRSGRPRPAPRDSCASRSMPTVAAVALVVCRILWKSERP